MANTYMSHEVADILGVSTSALRKWSPSLERAGYRFMRDEHNRRIYRDGDLVALRKMRELLQAGMSMENAAKSVWGLYRAEFDNDTVVLSVRPENQENNENAKRAHDERLQKLESKMDELIELNQLLVQQLQQRDQADRERYARFDQLQNDVFETRRLLAASAEEKPKKKWFEFWKSE